LPRRNRHPEEINSKEKGIKLKARKTKTNLPNDPKDPPTLDKKRQN
jgi:hypothetical protein